MKKVNLMTMGMFFRVLFTYRATQDREDLLDNYAEMLDLVHDSGFRGVDVISWEVQLLGLENVRQMLSQRGLHVGSYITFGEYAQADAEGFADRVAQGKREADIAKALDTKVLMLVPHAHAGIEGLRPEEIRAALAKHWQPITAYARELGLRVVAEDTPDQKLHFCAAEDVMEVLDRVPGLELVYDSANMTLVEEDPVEYLHKFAGRIGYVHLKDYRTAPAGKLMVEYAQDGRKMSTARMGTGIIDIPGVVKALEEIGYSGEMTVEFAEDDDGDFLKSLKRSYAFLESLKKEQ